MMLKNKKGQVVFFLVIAIVIIGGLIVVYSFRDSINTKTGTNSLTEDNQINMVLQDCVEQLSLDAVYLVGLQGGYTGIPKNNLNVGDYYIAYGLYQGKNILPTLPIIEDEITSFIESSLTLCLKSNDYPQLEIISRQANADVEIKSDWIQVSVSNPVSVSKDDKSFTLDNNYEVIVPIRLGKIHSDANKIIKKHLQNSDSIPITYLTEIEYDVSFIYYDTSTIIYTITDPEIGAEKSSYSYLFGVDSK